MTDNIISKEFIDVMIQDVLEAETRLRMTDRLVGSIEDEELRHYYNREILDLCDWYKILEQELVSQLSAYIAQEKGKNQVVDIYYHRVLKNLTK